MSEDVTELAVGTWLTLPDVGSIYPRLLMGRRWFYYLPSDHLYYFDRRTITRLPHFGSR